MKKTLRLILIVLLMVNMSYGLADESKDFTYDYAWLHLTGYTGQGGDITLPATMINPANTAKEWRALSVAAGAFAENQTITGISIPDNYQTISQDAFSQCTALARVDFPQGLAVIDDRAFLYCTALGEIVLPAGLSFIGNGAFYQAENLAVVRFEGPAPRMEKSAFGANAQGLTFYVPDDELEAYSAELAYAMGTDFNIIKSGRIAEHFDHAAVMGQALTVDAADVSPEEMFDFDADTGAITLYKGFCARVDIPASIGGAAVTAIDRKAFNNGNPNGYVYYVSIPQGVTLIEKSAFDSVPNLSWVELPSTLLEIGENAFYAFAGERLILNEGLESIGRRAFGFSAKRLTTISFPSTLRAIGEEAFSSCGAEKIQLNNGLVSLGDKAFYSSALMGELMLPEGLEIIGQEAFSRTDIEKVKFPSSLKTVGDQAFAWCMKLKALELSSYNVPEFGENVFEKVSAFHGVGYGEQLGAAVTIPGDGTQQQLADVQAAFDGMGLKVNAQLAAIDGLNVMEAKTYEIKLKNDQRLLANYMGDKTSVIAPEKYGDFYIDGVHDEAFKGNQSINTFAVPHNGKYTYIGREAFAYSLVSSVDLYTAVVTIDEGAFRNCKNLKAIKLPEGLTTIGAGAFSGCTSLEELIIPQSITNIGAGAFDGTKLKSFVIPVNVQMDPGIMKGIPLENIRIADDATDLQKTSWNDVLGFPWYNPLCRVSEISEYRTMPNTANDEADFVFDKENGRIDGYIGTSVDVVIPRSIDGVDVKTIGYSTFDLARNYADTDMFIDQTEWLPLRSVVIPQTVTELEDRSFSYCQELEHVICYGPLQSSGRETFRLCRNLKNVIFVNGAMMFDNYLFSGCESLETVYYRGTLDRIGANAFEFSGIGSFKANAKIISDAAFRNCENLTEIHIRDRVQKMELNVFNGCTSLNSICMEFRNPDVFDDENGYSGDCGGDTVLILPLDTTDDLLQQFYLKWYGGNLGPIIDEAHVRREACANPQKDPLPDLDALLASTDASPEYKPVQTVNPSQEEPMGDEVVIELANLTPFTDVIWVCTKAEASGYAIDTAMLGRYDVVFNADKSVRMTISGIEMPGATWTDDGLNITVDYYGIQYVFERVQAGLQMNYSDAMLLTYQVE